MRAYRGQGQSGSAVLSTAVGRGGMNMSEGRPGWRAAAALSTGSPSLRACVGRHVDNAKVEQAKNIGQAANLLPRRADGSG